MISFLTLELTLFPTVAAYVTRIANCSDLLMISFLTLELTLFPTVAAYVLLCIINISNSFTLCTTTLLKPFGWMLRVLLSVPYPIDGMGSAPLKRRRTRPSIPLGLRHEDRAIRLNRSA